MSTLLLIADGFGFSTGFAGNAITLARPRQFHYLWQRSSHAVLKTSDLVPLSRPIDAESAHFVIGTGTRPTFEVKDSLAEQPAALTALMADVRAGSSRLHVIAPLSIQTVAKVIPDLKVLTAMTAKENIQLVLHGLLGGPDAPPQGSSRLLLNLTKQIASLIVGSLSGMSFATTERLPERLIRQWLRGRAVTDDPAILLEQWYRRDGLDSELPPVLVNQAGQLGARDTILLLTPGGAPYLRLMTLLAEGKLPGFLFARSLPPLSLWTMRRIAPLKGRVKALLYPAAASQSFPHLLTQAGKKVLKLATKEKMDLLTFALNGGSDEALPGETIREIRLKGYSIEAEAEQLRVEINAALAANQFDFIIAHLSAIDRMVHAQDIAEASKAVTALDGLLRHLTDTVTKTKSDLLFLSAHGGAEQMLKSVAATSAVMLHSVNPVPFFLYRPTQPRTSMIESLALEIIEGTQTLLDVAPTILELFQISPPVPLEGRSIMSGQAVAKPGLGQLLAGLKKATM